MPIKLLPDGTAEERARMAKSAALADKLDLFLQAQKVTHGTVIEALGMLWATKSQTPDDARKFATDFSVAIATCFNLKEKARAAQETIHQGNQRPPV